MHPAGNSGSVRFFLASGPCIGIGNREVHTWVQLFPLDWNWAGLVSLPQVRYICQNYIVCGKTSKFRTRNVWKSRGLFRALGL